MFRPSFTINTHEPSVPLGELTAGDCFIFSGGTEVYQVVTPYYVPDKVRIVVVGTNEVDLVRHSALVTPVHILHVKAEVITNWKSKRKDFKCSNS